jgi:hypothetical protein
MFLITAIAAVLTAEVTVRYQYFDSSHHRNRFAPNLAMSCSN